jgi:DNA-binding NtrC family response regulator
MVADPGSRPRVVICECGCGRTEALRAALPEAGFDVLTCGTSEDLLEASLQRAPDVVLCQLGTASGVEAAVLRLFRRMSPHSSLVILSDGASLEVQRLAQEFRPVFFILEPLDPVELRDTIEAAITQRAKRNSTQL